MSSVGIPKDGSKAKVSNLNFTLIPIDKDIVALEVSVYNRGIMAVEIKKTPQDLPAPVLDCSQIYSLVSLPIPVTKM